VGMEYENLNNRCFRVKAIDVDDCKLVNSLQNIWNIHN